MSTSDQQGPAFSIEAPPTPTGSTRPETLLVAVEVAARRTTNLALQAGGVPLVDAVRLRNLGGSKLEKAKLLFTVEAEAAGSEPLGGPVELPLPPLYPGEPLVVGSVEVPVPLLRLASVQRPEAARLRWQLVWSGRALARGDLPVEVLPWDEWLGDQAPISVLVEFVMPDDPVVEVLARRVGGSSLPGEASPGGPASSPGEPLRGGEPVRARVQALFGAIRALGLRESELPGNVEATGLRLRLPSVLVAEQRANSVEMALLFASCLERMGISTLLASVGGRFLTGAWLSDDRFPEGVVHDLPRLRGAARQLLWLDPRLAAPEGGSWEAAVAAAAALLRDEASIRWVLDVRALRLEGLLPLPARPRPDLELQGDRIVRPIVQEILEEAKTQRIDPWLTAYLPSQQREAPKPPEPATTGRATARSPRSSLAGADEVVAARFRQWKDRLLDLSLRNRLLHFRLDARTTLPLEVPDLTVFVDLLSDRGGSETSLEVISRADLPAQSTLGFASRTVTPAPASPFEILEEGATEQGLEDLPTEEIATATLAARQPRQAPVEPTESRPGPVSEPGSEPGPDARLLERGKVRASLPDDERFARAVGLDRATRTDLEEGGANTLFVAVGFLRWSEGGDAGPARYAPLLLVPVALELHRSTRTVKVRRLAEDPIANVTLVEKLRRDFDLDLSGITNFESEDRAIDIQQVLKAARAAIEPMRSWEVLETAALGQFVFTKFLLWRDLEDNAERLLENPVVQHIARKAHIPYPNPVPSTPATELDQRIAPHVLPLVLDADSTQLAAIHGAMAGRSFVLQGPPGTGKSQTITNLVAAAISAGRTVLVVAEKMAALEVVHRRLKECGLGDFCLELHSHKTNKRQVISQLAAALKREAPGRPPWNERSAELKQCRDELNAYVQALHKPRANGRTFYEMSARQLALRHGPTVRLPIADPSALTDEDIRELIELVDRFSTAAREVEPVPAHPWCDARVQGWSQATEQNVLSRINRALDLEESVRTAKEELAGLLGVDAREVGTPALLEKLAQLGTELSKGPLPPPSIKPSEAAAFAERVRAYAGRYHTWQARSRTVAQRWHPTLYQEDLDRLYQLFADWSNAWFPIAFLMLFFARRELRRAARRVVPDNRSVTTDLSLAREVEKAREPLAEEKKALVQICRGAWSGVEVEELVKLTERAEALLEQIERARSLGLELKERALDYVDPSLTPERRKTLGKRSAEAARLLERFRTALGGLHDALGMARPGPDEPFDTVKLRLTRWKENADKLRPYARYCGLAAELQSKALGPVADLHRAGNIVASQLRMLFERSFGQQWLDTVFDAEPSLREFSGQERHRQVSRFRSLDRQHLVLGRHQVAASVDQRAPKLGAEVAEASEPGILLREAAKKTRQKSVRRLLQEIPNLLGRLKPCLLMSPLSVAQYLPADGRRFDLVVFDEASQIGTHDAIGALARGNQVVVVGDSRQLPPTTFFQRSAEEGTDENDFDELESILDEAVASGLPEEMLGWHYRSRHEGLIRFSNEHYYGGRLTVFPAARGHAEDLGISWHLVEGGVYDKSRTRTNRAEAKALVEHLVGSLIRCSPSARTFGVVTFSQAQQVLVSDLLDEARRIHPEIEPHFAHHEAVFVKNLENVQGDERDEILFSVGYGPDETGKVLMNFGPLNREGGERRLNVAITRARRQLRVFSTLTHQHIDLSRTRARGARHLKEFLRYAAEHGTIVQEPAASKDFRTLFEREVHDALVERGHQVAVAVGCGAYRLDLAVLRPDCPEGRREYLLGVELDGEAYQSAATARDRDRLRAEVLEGLGWRLHRIWSPDWWFNKEREIERLEAAIADALAGTPLPEPTPEPAPIRLELGPAFEPAPTPASDGTPKIEPYVEAQPTLVSSDAGSLHNAELLDELKRVIQQVLDVEGPIHLSLLTRRVGAVFGVTKLTERAKKRVLAVSRKLVPPPVVHGSFLWPAGMEPKDWDRVRTGNRDPEHLPPEEIAVAAAMVLAGNLAMPRANLVKETGKIFGMTRVGKKGAAALEAGIQVLIERGKAELQDEQVVGKG